MLVGSHKSDKRLGDNCTHGIAREPRVQAPVLGKTLEVLLQAPWLETGNLSGQALGERPLLAETCVSWALSQRLSFPGLVALQLLVV